MVLPDKQKGHVVYSWKPKDGAVQAIGSAIKDIYHPGEKYGAKDMVDKPRTIEIDLPCPEGLRAVTRKLQKDRVLDDKIIATPAQVALTLRQLSGGFYYRGEGGRTGADGGVARVHDTKLKWLAEMVEDLVENVLVAYWLS